MAVETSHLYPIMSSSPSTPRPVQELLTLASSLMNKEIDQTQFVQAIDRCPEDRLQDSLVLLLSEIRDKNETGVLLVRTCVDILHDRFNWDFTTTPNPTTPQPVRPAFAQWVQDTVARHTLGVRG
jgi:hypothetical protein